MQLIHAQHQAKTLAVANGFPVVVIAEGRDYLPASLDDAEANNKDFSFIAYPSGKTEVFHS